MRVAALDIGTNTVLLLVAEGDGSGGLRAVEEHATITRLGEGVDRTRTLAPAAIERTNDCLDRYAEIVSRLAVDRTAVVGTSAMRDAAGGEAVRAHVRDRFGVEARTISGADEARLTFAGALSGLGLPPGEVAVFDIGGGSTEIVVGEPARAVSPASTRFATSLDVGSVRLTERHVRHDPPTSEELRAIGRDLGEAFGGLPRLSFEEPIGIAGTMTTLAAVRLGLVPYDGARVHGHVLGVTELETVVRGLARMTLDDRRRVPGLEPKRADVIVAGGMIALGFLAALGADRVRISDRGVRWGLALELASPGEAQKNHQ